LSGANPARQSTNGGMQNKAGKVSSLNHSHPTNPFCTLSPCLPFPVSRLVSLQQLRRCDSFITAQEPKREKLRRCDTISTLFLRYRSDGAESVFLSVRLQSCHPYGIYKMFPKKIPFWF
jgi:hypothetical protein